MGNKIQWGDDGSNLLFGIGSNGEPQPMKNVDGQSHNRNIAAANITYASASNSVTWTTAVTDIEITVPNTASVTGVLVVYGAPNDAVASAWLTDAGSATSDVAYDYVLPNSVKIRQLSAGVTRIDVLPLVANTRLVIGAV